MLEVNISFAERLVYAEAMRLFQFAKAKLPMPVPHKALETDEERAAWMQEQKEFEEGILQRCVDIAYLGLKFTIDTVEIHDTGNVVRDG